MMEDDGIPSLSVSHTLQVLHNFCQAEIVSCKTKLNNNCTSATLHALLADFGLILLSLIAGRMLCVYLFL